MSWPHPALASPWAPYDEIMSTAKAAPAEAAAALIRLADEADDAVAAEALWQSARLSLDALHDPRRALIPLRRLIDGHPASAARARRALAWIEAQGSMDRAEAALALPTADPAQVAAWVARWPDWPAARLRLAELRPEAAAALDDLTGDEILGWRALRAKGRALTAVGDLAGALASYEAAGDTTGAALARRRLWMQRAAWAAWGLVAALALLALPRARRWWPPPTAVSYLGPVALATLLMAMPMSPAFAPALISLAVGAVALIWLWGAGPPPRTSTGRWLTAAARGLAMAALAYAIVHHFELVEVLWHTLKYGPE